MRRDVLNLQHDLGDREFGALAARAAMQRRTPEAQALFELGLSCESRAVTTVSLVTILAAHVNFVTSVMEALTDAERRLVGESGASPGLEHEDADQVRELP